MQAGSLRYFEPAKRRTPAEGAARLRPYEIYRAAARWLALCGREKAGASAPA